MLNKYKMEDNMLELNETMLEAVSGGWGSRKTITKKGYISIYNKNDSDVTIKNNVLGKNSGISVEVFQANSVGNTSIF
jgi:hypothetical protein